MCDDHKIVAQDFVYSSNFDSNINYLTEERDYLSFAIKVKTSWEGHTIGKLVKVL